MNSQEINKEKLRLLLIDLDAYHQALAEELCEAYGKGYFDPDVSYTPMHNVIRLLAGELGFNYRDDIAKESYHKATEKIGRREA